MHSGGPSMTNSAGLPPQPPVDNTKARKTKYTWSQLNQFVRDNHNNYASVNLRVPSSLTLADTTPSPPSLSLRRLQPLSTLKGAVKGAGGNLTGNSGSGKQERGMGDGNNNESTRSKEGASGGSIPMSTSAPTPTTPSNRAFHFNLDEHSRGGEEGWNPILGTYLTATGEHCYDHSRTNPDLIKHYESDERLYYLGYNREDSSREQTVQYIDLPSSRTIEDWSTLHSPPCQQPKCLLLPWMDGTATSTASNAHCNSRSSPKSRGFSGVNYNNNNRNSSNNSCANSTTSSSKYSGASSGGGSQQQLPREEQLLRERKRLPSMGISHFHTDPKCETIVFINAKALYYCKPRVREGLSPTLNSFTRSASSPHSPSSSYSPSHPSVCPSNPDLIAFICHKDIYVLNTKCQGQAVETRLTFTYKPPETPKVFTFLHGGWGSSGSNSNSNAATPLSASSGSGGDRWKADGKGGASVGSSCSGTVSAGVPCFVSMEEFNRYDGFWWQPTSQCYTGQDGSICELYRIMYEEVDESMVDVIKIQNPLNNRCEKYRYPKAGTRNATSALRLLTLSLNHTSGQVVLLSDCGLGENQIEACVPHAEYLTRCGWCSSGDYFWSQWLSRDQKRLFIVLTSVSAFNTSSSADSLNLFNAQGTQGGMGLEKEYSSSTSKQQAVNNINNNNNVSGGYGGTRKISDGLEFLDCTFNPQKETPSDQSISPDLHTVLSRLNNKPVLVQKIYEETSNYWINAHDIMHVVQSESSDDVITFIFASQQTKFRHLYYIQTRLVSHSSAGLNGVRMSGCHEDELEDLCLVHPVTTGEWEVLGKNLWVDEKRGLVYFMGLKDTEIESHLYVTSYKHPRLGIFRLSELGYSHSVQMNASCSAFVDWFSSLDTPPALVYCRLKPLSINTTHQNETETVVATVGDSEDSDSSMELGEEESSSSSSSSSADVVTSVKWFKLLVAGVESEANRFQLMDPQYPPIVHTPEHFAFQTSSSSSPHQCTLHGLLYKPNSFQQGIKYPCLLYVYAGPQVQIVKNEFKGQQFLRLHSLLSIGFTVVVVDGRGSANRGLLFEAHISHQLGSVEVHDQLEGLNYIASKSGCIDLNKVAVHGWSYGGYISLLALAQNPCKFMCAAAAAPVVNWREYDTGYTERYLGLPDENASAYGTSSVLNYIQHFPSEANRLLIIHGAIDENVHYRHTAMLINSLVMNCKPFVQITYPQERHGLRHTEASEHFETSLLHFFNSNANAN